MFKRILLTLALVAGLIAPAHGAGTIPLSLSQQFDSLGKPLINCYLYIIQAGTTSTPQNAYQDSALTITWPNPMRCDSAGRLSQFFLADGSIKIRLTDQNGVAQVVADGVLVIGPSGGGGGGSTVDATTVLTTGDFKMAYGTGALSGFVRCNGRTIGSATSGASERANADTNALFVALWNNDSNLSVSSGRGASAAADWSANKTITIPDCRGRLLAGLDDMGATAASRLTSTYFGATATTLGAAGGAESRTLTSAQIPSHTHSGTTSQVSANASHNHSGAVTNYRNGTVASGGGTGVAINAAGADISVAITSTNTDHTHTITTDGGTGGGGAHATVQPTILTTIYIKL